MPILGSFGAGSSRGFGLTSGSKELDFDYLVVAGGAAGIGGLSGGGGGGGFRTSFPGGTKVTISSGGTITIGDGGVSAPGTGATRIANQGQTSTAGDIDSAGGGCANATEAYPLVPNTDPTNQAIRDGGSGGGLGHQQTFTTGQGNVPPVSPPQGNPAGAGTGSFGSSGGGGAGTAGSAGTGSSPTSNSGGGGSGAANSITGGSVTYAGGGGGGGYTYNGGSAGPGGGGSGGSGGSGSAPYVGTAGTDGLGGGGGGSGPSPAQFNDGGSGIIVLRIPTADAPAVAVTPGTNSVATDGSDKVCTFTVSGTVSF